MKKYASLVLFSLLWSSLVFGSDLTSQKSTLYPYKSTIELQDDFLSGTTASGSVGTLGWSSAGTITTQVSVANRLGVYRIDTGAVSGTQARINFISSALLDPALPTTQTFIARLNTNDANTTVRIGSANGISADPPIHGIYFEKLDPDVNWFCITRAGAVQTRTDSGVPVTVNFEAFVISRKSTGVDFLINGVTVCPAQNTNIPTTFIGSYFWIINSAAASKTMDVDYWDIRLTGLVR